jgi:hypothetical protein
MNEEHGVLLKHKIYAEEYVSYLRHQARKRVFEGLNLEALDSCGASLGQTDEDIERTRRAWEATAQHDELDNIERTLRRQREGLDLLLERGATIDSTTTEPCPPSEHDRIAASAYTPAPSAKFLVYHVRAN